MVIDSTQFPLVRMQVGASGIDTDDEGFKAFEALLGRAEPFVLLDEERTQQEEHEHSHEERKQLSLWMKRHKAALRSFVKAQVYIEPDLVKRKAAELFAGKFEAFWGYPLRVVATREEGLTLARKLLAQ
ncbi:MULTISPECIES: hypothetical protein [Pseudomonas]|uniref:hypothetical protein n=1 Tax=Pseudomonas TaxID=286 RepID=UPI0021BEA70E|nr:hypothetical protein [Pseudomonas citronellolis]UXJ54739.1 hypothetical protein N5P21_11215 [Pseudomonas citronellolis]WBG62667.1 hypothetical protein ELR50_07135 [Pseudomonas citronellolis]